MDLIVKTKNYINSNKVFYKLIELVKLLSSNSTLNLYIETINELTNKISKNIEEYTKTLNKVNYNLIDNDFVTLNDLILEFKDNYYKTYDVEDIVLLSSFNYYELEDMILYKLNNDLNICNIIDSLLEIDFPLDIKVKIERINSNNIEVEKNLLMLLKQFKKHSNNQSINILYNKLAVIYLNNKWN